MEQFVSDLKALIPAVDFKGEHNLVNNGILDSLSLVSIMLMISEKYGVEIPIDDMTPENFDSVDSMNRLIKRLKASGKADG